MFSGGFPMSYVRGGLVVDMWGRGEVGDTCLCTCRAQLRPGLTDLPQLVFLDGKQLNRVDGAAQDCDLWS